MSNTFRGLANRFKHVGDKMTKDLKTKLSDISDDIVSDMKANLTMNNNIDTGDLINSCRKEMVETDEYTVTVDIYADAKSDDGKYYAPFLEYGTGIYNPSGGGRKDGWYYEYTGNKGNSPEIRHTYGNKPYPFFNPAFDANESKLAAMITKIDIKDYMG